MEKLELKETAVSIMVKMFANFCLQKHVTMRPHYKDPSKALEFHYLQDKFTLHLNIINDPLPLKLVS